MEWATFVRGAVALIGRFSGDVRWPGSWTLRTPMDNRTFRRALSVAVLLAAIATGRAAAQARAEDGNQSQNAGEAPEEITVTTAACEQPVVDADDDRTVPPERTEECRREEKREKAEYERLIKERMDK